MKKIMFSIFIFISFSPRTINAYEAPDPYIVTQTITNDVISQEECLIIINHSISSDIDESYENGISQETLMQIEQEIQNKQTEYEQINVAIAQLEEGESDSLAWATLQLDFVVEQVYYDYWENDDNFAYLTEEEQLDIISKHEVVLSWQNYIQEIQQIINQLITDRTLIEEQYLSLNYDYNNLLRYLEEEETERVNLNQCQLYPYTSEYISVDQILLNQQHSLNDYLVQTDSYLSKMVPKAYRQVAFADIYRLFSQNLSNEVLDESLANKPNIVLDSEALNLYSYARELSLVDIETMALYAQRAYLKDNNIVAFNKAYQDIIALKESQWAYIYQSNTVAFDYLMDSLATYLNSMEAFDEESITLVRALQQRYQVKLVIYDENNGVWLASGHTKTGFSDEYFNLSLEQVEQQDNIESLSLISDEEVSESTQDENLSELDETNENNLEDLQANDNLDALKNQLAATRTDSNVRDLPKPSVNDLKSNESSKNETKKNTGNIKLPDTGERQPYTIIALIFLFLGGVLVIYNYVTKYLKRKNIEKIELD